MPFITATTGEVLLTTEIQWFGRRCLAICDRNCDKAYGLNGDRPQISLSEDADDVAWLADNEVGPSPESGTWEGGHGKPDHPDRHNKWCVRECERSEVIEVGQLIECKNWKTRIYNQPKKHNLTNANLVTGQTY
jgi:hypothetical protein